MDDDASVLCLPLLAEGPAVLHPAVRPCAGPCQLVTGVLQCVLFPRSGLLGASGIVFMLIMLSSLAGFSGGIPVTMLLVAALYFGQQVYDIIFVHDNVANFMHIVGGLCGTAFGYYSALHSRRRPAKAVKFSSTNSRRKR